MLELRPPKQQSKNKTKTKPSKNLKLTSVPVAMNHFQQKGCPYSDWFVLDQAVSSTLTSYSVLSQIAVQFNATPQITKPITFGAGTIRYQAAVQLHGVVVKIRTIGAQATTLLYGDLYNSIRTMLYISGSTLSDTPDSVGAGVDTMFNQTDVTKLLLDHTFDLPSTAYIQSNSYNVPNVKSQYVYIPINQRFDFFTTGTSTTNWDTRKNNLVFTHVSDSSATPHPQLNVSIRMYYDLIQ